MRIHYIAWRIFNVA